MWNRNKSTKVNISARFFVNILFFCHTSCHFNFLCELCFISWKDNVEFLQFYLIQLSGNHKELSCSISSACVPERPVLHRCLLTVRTVLNSSLQCRIEMRLLMLRKHLTALSLQHTLLFSLRLSEFWLIEYLKSLVIPNRLVDFALLLLVVVLNRIWILGLRNMSSQCLLLLNTALLNKLLRAVMKGILQVRQNSTVSLY